MGTCRKMLAGDGIRCFLGGWGWGRDEMGRMGKDSDTTTTARVAPQKSALQQAFTAPPRMPTTVWKRDDSAMSRRESSDLWLEDL